MSGSWAPGKESANSIRKNINRAARVIDIVTPDKMAKGDGLFT